MLRFPVFKGCTILHQNKNETCTKTKIHPLYGIRLDLFLTFCYNLNLLATLEVLSSSRCLHSFHRKRHTGIRRVETQSVHHLCLFWLTSLLSLFLVLHVLSNEPPSLIPSVTKTKHKHNFFFNESSRRVYRMASLNSVISGARRLKWPKTAWKPISCVAQPVFYCCVT